jgi:hypothetical protein
VKHRYEPDDGPRDLVWYAPAVNVGRSVAVEQRQSIFASAYNQIIALGGWDTVAAVATAAATRPTRSGS